MPSMKKAIYYMLISAVAFTAMNILVKYLDHFSGAELVLFRAAGSLFFTFPYLIYHKIPIGGNQKKLLLLRGIAGVTSMALFFMAIGYLPVGSAVTLRYISPIFATVFAVILLKEKVRRIQWLFFGIAFAGVLMVKGYTPNINSYGLFLVLLSAVFSGLVYIIINKIGHRDHPVVVVNYFMCVSVFVGGVLSIFNWRTPKGLEWLLLLSLGVFGYFGQLFMTKAFQSQATNKIVSLKYLEVLTTLTVGVILFGDRYSFLSLIGTVLIIAGLILNVWYRKK